MTETIDMATMMARAVELLADPDQEYDLRELVKGGAVFRIHDYETMGDRPVGTYDCGSAPLKDTPKALYRAVFLFSPERLSFKQMYKGNLFTLVSPDYSLVASVEFFKYELAIYFSASKEHVEGHESGVICGAPGSDNGIRLKDELAQAWFGLITRLLDHEWGVYGGNNFSV